MPDAPPPRDPSKTGTVSLADANASSSGDDGGERARESDRLHARVQRFARTALSHETEPSDTGDDDFDRLATDIARFQSECIPGFARLVERWGSRLESADDIPAVPVDAFRLSRVATFPEALTVARFRTSGTTGGESGLHHLRRLDTYRQLAADLGRRALFSAVRTPKTIVALVPIPTEPPTSSLGFMMQVFMESEDGKALVPDPRGVPFSSRAPERWLAGPGGVDVDGLMRACRIARTRQEGLFVLAPAFALVALLDALEGDRLPCPTGGRTVVMQTGGFKGRSRSVDPQALRAAVAKAFQTTEDAVVGEYGMTELCSQLYEGTVPGAELQGPRNVYLEPPWLRATPVHPTTLEPVAEGEVGIARFVDLANVDSAVAILTQDLIRRRDGGIELLGRRASAPPRGCSLPYEALICGPTSPGGRS